MILFARIIGRAAPYGTHCGGKTLLFRVGKMDWFLTLLFPMFIRKIEDGNPSPHLGERLRTVRPYSLSLRAGAQACPSGPISGRLRAAQTRHAEPRPSRKRSAFSFRVRVARRILAFRLDRLRLGPSVAWTAGRLPLWRTGCEMERRVR
jgi:hypothetical protein